MGKTYVFLADGFEEIEALMVVDILRRAEMEVRTVSVTGNKMVTGSHNIRVEADEVIAGVDFNEAETLVLPGGVPGTPNLAACSILTDKLREFGKEGKRLAAICAAPSILGSLGLLEGKKAVCFPGWEDKLTGARVQYDAKTVTDGNIITGRGMGTAIDFALTLVAEAKGGRLADEIGKAVQYLL